MKRTLHLSTPQTRYLESGLTTVSSWMSLPDREPQELWVKLPNAAPFDRADAFVAMSLLPAMALGLDLVSEAPISQSLLETALPAVQHIFRIWHDEDNYLDSRTVYRPIQVFAPTVDDAPVGPGTGLYFSAGIDSSFSLIELAPRLTHLIFIENFEEAFPRDQAETARNGVAAIAAAFDKKVIFAETNAKNVFGGIVSWGYYHGSMMAGIGLALQNQLGEVYIASSADVRTMHPWGSHPCLDHLWSSRSLRFTHDRIDVTRLEKTFIVSSYPAIMENLRVCWRPLHNCGACSKCTRTILALQVLNRDTSPAFSRGPLSPHELARLDVRQGHTYYREIGDYLEDTGTRPDLLSALRIAQSGRYQTALGSLMRGDLDKRILRAAKRIGFRTLDSTGMISSYRSLRDMLQRGTNGEREREEPIELDS